MSADAGSTVHYPVRGCRSYILSHLVQTMEERSRPGVDWITNERLAVVVAANEWAQANGYERRVTVADVERIEGNAIGHTDYASKLALYVAEFIIDPAPWQEATNG